MDGESEFRSEDCSAELQEDAVGKNVRSSSSEGESRVGNLMATRKGSPRKTRLMKCLLETLGFVNAVEGGDLKMLLLD